MCAAVQKYRQSGMVTLRTCHYRLPSFVWVGVSLV